MRKEEPLLFIQSPVIRKFIYTPAVTEESTAIFEIESALQTEEEELEQTAPGEVAVPAADDTILYRLNHLNHPFRRELYQPIEIVTDAAVVRGKVQDVKEGWLLMDVENELVSIAVGDVREINWKEQSFLI